MKDRFVPPVLYRLFLILPAGAYAMPRPPV